MIIHNTTTGVAPSHSGVTITNTMGEACDDENKRMELSLL
jgi:hypothetical protein